MYKSLALVELLEGNFSELLALAEDSTTERETFWLLLEVKESLDMEVSSPADLSPVCPRA
jgi:hypothetical protein